MKCPTCSNESTVADSRTHGVVVRRRRRCHSCGYRWSTEELPIDMTGRRGVRGHRSAVPASHPVVQFIFEEKNRRELDYAELSRRSRVPVDTIRGLNGRSIPRLDTLDQVLMGLGYELHVRKAKP